MSEKSISFSMQGYDEDTEEDVTVEIVATVDFLQRDDVYLTVDDRIVMIPNAAARALAEFILKETQ